MDEKKPINPLDSLKDVVGDLWGSTLRLSRENSAQLDQLTRELQKDKGLEVPEESAVPDIYARRLQDALMESARMLNEPLAAAPKAAEKPAEQPAQKPAEAPAPAPEEKPAEPEKPAYPPFESFWKLADETVDWTEALAHPYPTDGLTSENLWQFFHEHAEGVLNGDLSAYLEVLKAANPLGDLTPYARGFNVRAESADRLTVSFEALPAYMGKEETEIRRYLSGMVLRCARDLLALLPVREVHVEARFLTKPMLIVPFERAELQKVRLSFTDPEQLVKRCGGEFQF